VPGSLEVLAQIVALPDDALQRPVALADGARAPIQFVLYDCLRREQALHNGADRAIDPRAELPIRHTLPMIDDGLPIGMGCGLLVQDCVEGVRAPVARTCVMLDEVWRKTRVEDRHEDFLQHVIDDGAR